TVGQFPNPGGNPNQNQAAFIGFGTAPGHYLGEAGDLSLATQSRSASSTSAIRFLTPVDDVGNYAERMRISREGNIGIGTTNPQATLDVNGNIVTNGDISLTNVDCAEDFDVEDPHAIEPGTVMIVGDAGRLHLSQEAYDTRVAGVISGAGDYRPAIIL